VSQKQHAPRATLGAERTGAFVDAVVAIAMTLLILPLMESVSDVAGEDLSVGHWFDEHRPQVVSFLISFALNAMFWMNQHRMFAAVRGVSVAFMWLTVAWLLSIVWLPVATSMSGQMGDRDPVVKVVYIGSMILIAVLSLSCRLYLRAHPDLTDTSTHDMNDGITVDVSMVVLFGLSLLVAVLVPAVGYWALCLMALTGVLQNILARRAR
jgi:uncharacterized membrane protein